MMHKTQIFNANMGGDYPEFCVTAKMRCKIELIFQGGSGVGCARLVYNITPTSGNVKGGEAVHIPLTFLRSRC